MIPKQKVIELAGGIKNDARYESALEKALELVGTDALSSEHVFIEEFFKLLAINNWTRAKSYGFLANVWDCYEERMLLSEQLHDILETISTKITGYCAPEFVARFPDDPENLIDLRSYVLSGSWYIEE